MLDFLVGICLLLPDQSLQILSKLYIVSEDMEVALRLASELGLVVDPLEFQIVMKKMETWYLTMDILSPLLNKVIVYQ